MGITVLGPLTVDGSGRLGPRDRVVLQALATRPGQPLSADELMDALWADHPPASAAKNLQSCIVRLRKVLGGASIETSPHGYALTVPDDAIDAREFEAQAARARELLAVGEADRVAFLLERTLALWHGTPFADLPDWPPAQREAGRLAELRLEVEEMYVDALMRSGRPREVLARAHEMVRAAPLRERRWELLALAQYRTGAQGEALRTIRQLRAVLAHELGIDPSAEMAALEQSILRQDSGLLHDGEVSQAPATCPWLGLQAYDVTEADRFFGREAEIAAGLAILAGHHLLALVGPSGSGKSSLMRAGIGACLQLRGTRCVTVTPGRYPSHALTPLSSAGPGDALLIDQAEELFTLCEDPDETRAFIDRLVEESSNRLVVVALRADRLADLTAYPSFSRLVERGLYLVGGLDEAGLRLAVVEPARQAGLILEPGLVDVLVTELREDPGALPLLSHALLETWKRREGNTLTVDGYRATGGIHGAVAQSAEQLYARVEPDSRQALRDLVLRLLTPGTEGEPVRTRVPRRLVGNEPGHDRLIEMLVSARLVTSDDGVLEITHESLARAWPRLRGWLEDDVDGRRILHHLSSTADAWDTLGRPGSELYRGVRLTRALDWCASTGASLTSVERDFLEAARVEAEVEERSAAERARSQARLIRRLRIVLAGATVLLVLALVAGGIAAVQSDRASESAARAEQAAISADAGRVGARAQLADDLSLSLLLAVAGARLDDAPETRANLLAALSQQPTLVRSAPPGGGFVDLMSVSPDGRWIAASDNHNVMHLYDGATNRLLRSYDPGRTTENEEVTIGAFSQDSTQLAVVLQFQHVTDPVRLLDPLTMQPTADLAPPGDGPVVSFDLQFSADGRYLAANMQAHAPDGSLSTRPGYVAVWDVRSPATPPVRVQTGDGFQGVALSPDGQTLYTSMPLTAYDVASGDRIWRRLKQTSGTLDLNTKGTLLALVVGKDALLVDPVTGTTIHTLKGHRDRIFEIRFSPDGSLVGTIGGGELIVWDADTGRTVARLQTSDPWGVGFGPDNDLVYSGGGDSMLRTWDLTVEDTYLQQTAHVADLEPVVQAHISPDGRQVAYRSLDEQGTGWITFVDTRTGDATTATRVPVNEGEYPIGSWHPGGERYAAICDLCGSGSVSVLDTATGERLRERDVVPGDGGLLSLAHVDEGRSLLAGSTDVETLILDASTLRPRGEPFEIIADCCGTPIGDGSRAVVYDHYGDNASAHWRVVDVGTGDTLSEGDVPVGVIASVASPDGSTFAVAGHAGEIVTTDTATGAEQRRSASLGAAVYWLEYSWDGELLVSAAEDGGVSLWDATTLDLQGTVYPPHDGTPVPASAHFIGDTHDVAIASFDGGVYRWETDVERALDFACQMAGRDLTEEEWAQFLPTQPYRSVCPQE